MNKFAKKLTISLICIAFVVYICAQNLKNSSHIKINSEQSLYQSDQSTALDPKHTTAEEVVYFAEYAPGQIREHDQNIFFFETGGVDYLTARQACVVESALLHHQNKVVYLFITGVNITSTDVMNNPFYSNLLQYPNIRIRRLDTLSIFKKSPLWNWFVYSDWQTSIKRAEILRIGLSLDFLHKYGGTAFSFGVLCLKSVDNIIGECLPNQISLDVLSFRTQNRFVQTLLDKLEKDFRSVEMTSKGLTAALLSLCQVGSLKELQYSDCTQLQSRVVKPAVLCPVEQNRYWILFDENRRKIAENLIGEKDTRAVNLWVEDSRVLKEWGSHAFKSVIFKLAEEHCPVTFLSTNYSL